MPLQQRQRGERTPPGTFPKETGMVLSGAETVEFNLSVSGEETVMPEGGVSFIVSDIEKKSVIEARIESDSAFIKRMESQYEGEGYITIDLERRKIVATAPTAHEMAEELRLKEYDEENVLILRTYLAVGYILPGPKPVSSQFVLLWHVTLG